MIGPPPSGLPDAELGRLDIALLPVPDDMEEVAVYRFEDTGEFLAEDDETESAIRAAFPDAAIRRV